MLNFDAEMVFWSCLLSFILWLRVSPANADEWRAEVPESVVGLSGSCVVIPCKFSYPAKGTTYTEFTGIWYKGHYESTVYHTDTSKISDTFKGRTNLVGDLQQNDCSLKIGSLSSSSDTGPFVFRIEIKHLDKYTYEQNKVSITVKETPETPSISVEEEVTSGKPVTATCAVSHSCPSDLPHVTWNHNSTSSSPSQPQNHGQWNLTSYSLTFTPSREDHNKSLSCSAEFKGKIVVTGYKMLKVKYPPEIKSESSCQSTTLTVCVCIVDSNPASEVKWFGPDSSKNFSSTSIKQKESLTIFTLQGQLGFPKTVQCFANNSLGTSSITLKAPQNGTIMYIAVASAVVVVLVAILVYVVRRRCGNRATQQPVMKNVQNEMKTTPNKSDLENSKEDKGSNEDIYTNCPESRVYDNWGCDVRRFSSDHALEDEAVYANM